MGVKVCGYGLKVETSGSPRFDHEMSPKEPPSRRVFELVVPYGRA